MGKVSMRVGVGALIAAMLAVGAGVGARAGYAIGDGLGAGGGGLGGGDLSGGGVGPPATVYQNVFTPGSDTSNPHPIPALLPVVDCSIVTPTAVTYWWGYNLLPNSTLHGGAMDEPVGADNTMSDWSSSTGAVAAPNLGQVTEFQPGQHTMVFATTVAPNHMPVWTVTSPVVGSAGTFASVVGSFSVTAYPAVLPACPSGTSTHSAVPQDTGASDITITPVKTVKARGLLRKARLAFGVTGVTSACSAGGTPLAPTALWGFTEQIDGVGNATTNLAAVDPLVRSDDFDLLGSPWTAQRTTNPVRTITDPQRVYTTQDGVVSHGLVTTGVIVDVTARCRFAAKAVAGRAASVIVESTVTHWVYGWGGPRPVRYVTDATTQLPRPVDCTILPTCELDLGIGPGGVTHR